MFMSISRNDSRDSNAGVSNLGEFPPRGGGNKRIAGGNGGFPRICHSFHMVVRRIEIPRITKF